MDDIVILSGARTPIGSFLGSLSSVPAPRLGAAAIKAALERAGVSAEQVEQVIMGNVLQAGQGQAPARQAGIYAGIPYQAGAVTVHKVCGSALPVIDQFGFSRFVQFEKRHWERDKNNGIRHDKSGFFWK